MKWTLIKTETCYQKALARLDEIFDSKKGDKTFVEAEQLVLLIEKYETDAEPAFPDHDL